MSKQNTRQSKQEWAKDLYLSGQFTQKEIAGKVDITEKTIGSWIRKYGWEDLKANVMITKEKQLKFSYAQLNAINELIEDREPGKRFPTSKEADVISKLSATIKNLEQDLSVSQVIDVFIEFTDWLKKIDMVKAKEFISLQDGFIKSKLAGK